MSNFGSDVIAELIAVFHKRECHRTSCVGASSLVEALPQFDFVDKVTLFLLKEEHFVGRKMEVKNHRKPLGSNKVPDHFGCAV